MNNTHSNHPAPSEPGLKDAGLDDLMKDVLRVGPAPTRSREALAVVINLALVGAVVGILQPEPVVAAGLIAAVVVYLAIRWVTGTRKWSAR